MQELLKKLDDGLQAMWLERPEDVERMVGRNYETGKEFSCWAYCWGYLSNLGDSLYTLYGMANDEEGDPKVLGAYFARRLRGYAGSFTAAGHMSDIASLLEESADAFENIDSFVDMAKLARTLQRYVMQLSFWADMELPWAEVSEYVDKRWHE